MSEFDNTTSFCTADPVLAIRSPHVEEPDLPHTANPTEHHRQRRLIAMNRPEPQFKLICNPPRSVGFNHFSNATNQPRKG